MPKATKTATKGPTKSDFIRKFSVTTSASDIVAKAKAANLKLTPSFVYAIRAMDKKRKGGAKAAKSANAAPSVTTSAAPAAAASGRKSVNKSAWVRSLPASMSASEVIAKGKAQGIKLTAAQVYTVRANAKRTGGAAAAPVVAKAKGKPGPKPGSKRKPATAAVAPSKASSNGHGSHDHSFVNLVLNIGLSKAEALLAHVREKMTAGL